MNSPTMTSESFGTSEHKPDEMKRVKRAIIFRPLFVYRQQQIKKQRLKEMREQQRPITTHRPTIQKPRYASNYPYYYHYMG